jgi:hypothetical protein
VVAVQPTLVEHRVQIRYLAQSHLLVADLDLAEIVVLLAEMGVLGVGVEELPDPLEVLEILHQQVHHKETTEDRAVLTLEI